MSYMYIYKEETEDAWFDGLSGLPDLYIEFHSFIHLELKLAALAAHGRSLATGRSFLHKAHLVSCQFYLARAFNRDFAFNGRLILFTLFFLFKMKK